MPVSEYQAESADWKAILAEYKAQTEALNLQLTEAQKQLKVSTETIATWPESLRDVTSAMKQQSDEVTSLILEKDIELWIYRGVIAAFTVKLLIDTIPP